MTTAKNSRIIRLSKAANKGFTGEQSTDSGASWQTIAGAKGRKQWRAYASENGFTLREVRKAKALAGINS